ncbi:MAG: WYL domain-containing protein [Proteobacteria bacterium]|nr:WYL domain-containing protein [Pseudomonadota bacterium]
MPDMTKSRRLDELKSRFMVGARFTIGKMEREFGVTRRTANRDLLDLQEMGLDLRYEELSEGQRQWYLGFASRNVHVTYSIRDVMSLFLGRRMFDFLENTSLEDSMGRVYSRIETQLSRQKDLDNAEKLGQKIYLIHEGPKKLPKKTSEILDEVLSGLLHEHKVKIRYVNSAGVENAFIIHPFTLVAYKRGLYMLARIDGADVKRTFAIERIKSAKWLKGEHFEYPKNYDPEKFFDKALFIAPANPVPVEIVFTKGTKPFIKFRKFHKSQKLKDLADGRVKMTLKVPVNFETVNWILSFGSNAKVISPPELRDMVRRELEKALKNYRC